MRSLLTPLLVCLISLSFGQKLEQKWRAEGFKVPESVLLDAAHNVLYVANIDGTPDGKDGKGFISQLGLDGKVKKLDWVTGLDAPKGMGIYKDKLYVTDITRVDVIDIKTGKVTDKIEIAGAQFLNDISIDAKGTVYISDSSTGKIHTLKGNKPEVYLENAELKGTNGVLAVGDWLYVVDFGNGANYKVSKDKKLTKFSTTSEGADGVVAVGNGDYIVSNWHGEIYYVDAAGKSTKLIDTKDKKVNSADIEFNSKTKTLYVPTFFDHAVVAYELKK